MPTKGKKNRKREACVEKFVNKWWMPELMFRVMELVFFGVATDFLRVRVRVRVRNDFIMTSGALQIISIQKEVP